MVVSTNGTDTQLRNNICLANGNGAILDQGQNSSCSNNLNVNGCSTTQGSTNPFVSTSDFHLAADDNGGVAIAGLTTDRDGLARGDPPDRGAYDFVGAGVTAGGTIFFGRGIR